MRQTLQFSGKLTMTFADVLMLHKNKQTKLFKIFLHKTDTGFLPVISDYQSNSSVSSPAIHFLVTLLKKRR